MYGLHISLLLIKLNIEYLKFQQLLQWRLISITQCLKLKELFPKVINWFSA